MQFKVLVDQGSRNHMEDRWSVKKIPICKNSRKTDMLLITVADGHGGHTVADFAIEAAPEALAEPGRKPSAAASGCRGTPPTVASRLLSDVAYARTMFDVYSRIDAVACGGDYSKTTGCTLCTVAVSLEEDCLVAANCGDTMAVVGNRRGARSLSQEHKASSEVKAIESRGGVVIAPDGMPRVNGTLNLSRAIGDAYLKRYITSSPFVTRCRPSDFCYMIVATDGVWDVLTVDDIHSIVSRHMWPLSKSSSNSSDDRLADVLRTIFYESRRRGSGDNIAIVGCVWNVDHQNERRIL